MNLTKIFATLTLSTLKGVFSGNTDTRRKKRRKPEINIGGQDTHTVCV